MRLHTKIEIKTAKSVATLRAVWLGKNGENLILLSKNAKYVVPRNTTSDNNALAQCE